MVNKLAFLMWRPKSKLFGKFQKTNLQDPNELGYNKLVFSRIGGIGRRARLKIVWQQCHGGSIPSFGTICYDYY